MIELIILLVLLSLGYFIGSHREKIHYQSIREREKDFSYMVTTSMKKVEFPQPVHDAQLVAGSVVISVDYFKSFLATLRSIFGGRIKSYETLLDRARREAILRMQEEAAKINAKSIINFRIETANIGSQRSKNSNMGAVEALAYGTAISYAPHFSK